MSILNRVKRSFALACLGLLMSAGLAASAASAAPAPLSTYGALPLIEDARISPDGTMIAFSVTDGENRVVMIRRTSDNELIGGIRAGDQKIRDVRWGGNQYVIVTLSQTSLVPGLTGPRREYMISITYDLATKKQRGLMDRAANSMNTVLSMPQVLMIDGELSAIVEGVNFVDNQGRVGLFRVKLRTGHAKLIEEGFPDTTDWVIGPDGSPVAETEYDQKTGQWRLKLKTASGWKTFDESVALLGRPWLAGLGREGKSVLIGEYDEDGKVLHREYPTGGGAAKPMDTPYEDLIHDPATLALIGSSQLVGETYRYAFYDPHDEAVWKAVVKAYPATNRIHLASWSHDRRKIVVLVDSPEEGGGYALVDLDKKSARWLGAQYGALTPADISPVQTISYKAKDGLTITGYLTLPRGKDPRNLPLVVLPHGGPAARDVPGFDWWAQALASRGYAVLQPNFRGSDGLGASFLEAGYGEWGRKMQTDLSDGVRDLAAKGTIDPKRVCIVGASYGGYAAMAGPTLDQGIYRCAVAVAGISDLRRFMDATVASYGSTNNAGLRYLARFLGVEGRRDPDLAAISPVTFAARADAPMLMIHGKDDTVVLYNQSQIMYGALRKAGKPAELVTLKGEDHWLSRGDTRLQMLTAIVEFLEKHNPPE